MIVLSSSNVTNRDVFLPVSNGPTANIFSNASSLDFFFFFPSKAQLSCLLSAYFLSGRVLVPLYVVQFHQDETRFWGTCWY